MNDIMPGRDLTDEDRNLAYLHVAAESSNPTIMDAIDNLKMLVRMTDPENADYMLRVLGMNRAIDHIRAGRIDKGKVSRIVEEIIHRADNDGLTALENLIDVSYRRRGRSHG